MGYFDTFFDVDMYTSTKSKWAVTKILDVRRPVFFIVYFIYFNKKANGTDLNHVSLEWGGGIPLNLDTRNIFIINKADHYGLLFFCAIILDVRRPVFLCAKKILLHKRKSPVKPSLIFKNRLSYGRRGWIYFHDLC